jgi:hypothetical protein
MRRTLTGRTWLALAIVLGVGVLIGYLSAPRSEEQVLQVNVRQGQPLTSDDVDAVVRVRSELIEALVQEALEEADLPFDMDEIQVSSTTTGLHINSRLGIEAAGLHLRGQFSTDAHPLVEDDGTLGVELTSTRIVGARVPGIVEKTLRSIVSKQVSEATRLEGYRVRAVETSQDEFIVYLQLTEPLHVSLGD